LSLAAFGSGGLLAVSRALGATSTLSGNLDLSPGGRDFSVATRRERTAIPSACWQCVTRDAIVGYVEDGRLVKIEGHPEMLSSGGKLCARGQAGINQVYNPDRLLHPIKRVGRRGEGKWQRISWEEALDLLVNGGEIAGRKVRGLRTLRDEGTPEKFMFHYGRMTGTDYLILLYYFMPLYGTATIGDHNSICISAGGVARGLTGDAGGATYDEAKIILNFGASDLEAGFDCVANARAVMDAMARGAKMYTFDVRLSNTAAKSTEWVPVKPGTDLAVILAMCHVLMENDLHDADFIRDHTNVSVPELREHLAPYTPGWAEEISGVPAERIRSIAVEFGHTKPGACLGLRGLFMHHNGVQAQRALYMLRAISGNVKGTGTRQPRPQWKYAVPFPRPATPPKALNILAGEEGAFAITDWGVSHQIVKMIDRGPERPDVCLVYCHNPVFANGDCKANARLYADEDKIPFLVGVDVALSETSELADLVLPDATYLERWTCEGKTSRDGVPEYYLRQPMHPPLGEARNFVDVACELARRMDFDLGFDSAEDFVRMTCDNTPRIKEAGGFEYMRKHGIWHDRQASPGAYERGVIEIKSTSLHEKGFDGIPAWMPIPTHETMSEDDLILTTFKVPVQTHSRTQGCKWLSELYHENPAWLNPVTAAARGIDDGDPIVVRSALGELVTTAFVTTGVHPKVVAISHHAGHWAWGEYASGKRTPVHVLESDSGNKWWNDHGAHPNTIIPNVGDPIAGSMCWMDTIVKVSKV
jgi:anaerobic selenocysteine-containing dehydrogenase